MASIKRKISQSSMLSFVSKTKRKSNEGNNKDETMNTTIDTKNKENSKQENNEKQPQELKSGTGLKSDISSPDQEARAKDSKEGAVSEKFTTESEDTGSKTTWEANKSKIKPLHITDYEDLLVKTFGNLVESHSFHHHFVCSNRGCSLLSAEETQRQSNQRNKSQHNWILQPQTAFDSKQIVGG